MIPLLAIIIFMMNFFSSLQAREGGARQHADHLMTILLATDTAERIFLHYPFMAHLRKNKIPTIGHQLSKLGELSRSD